MHILAYDPYVATDTMAASRVEPVGLDTLLSISDFVSLHCPLTPQTRHSISSRELRLMKRTAVVVNTSRGPVIDERALVEALTQGWIAAAGLDVLEDEPPGTDNPLLQMDNVVLTPHAAGSSADGVQMRWHLSLETIIALARRRWPPACVNPGVNCRQALMPG
jgi:D-3-phosphoglycerate dehydrogenase